MLSKKDKEWIQETILKSLTVRIKMEKHRDEKTGQPLAIPEITEEDVYLPVFWVKYLPYFEGAVRGIQETMDLVKNSDGRNMKAIEAMGKILIGLEDTIVNFSLASNKLLEISNATKKDIKLIDVS